MGITQKEYKITKLEGGCILLKPDNTQWAHPDTDRSIDVIIAEVTSELKARCDAATASQQVTLSTTTNTIS